MKHNIINEKKIKLVKLVIVLSLIYSSLLAITEIFGITAHIEYRAPLMIVYAICNIILLFVIQKSKEFNIKIAYTVLALALVVFSITMIIYPTSEIRVMWYFFTIMIGYYVGGRKVGHIVAITSIIILFLINTLFSLGFPSSTMANITIGILFIAQISNYFVSILEKNEKDLLNSNNQIKELLNNAGQGFLYFDKDMKIGAEYSKEAIRIFEKEIVDENIVSLLYPDDNDKQSQNSETLKDILTEDDMTQEILISLLEKEFKINDKFIEVEYKVLNSKTFMMILTDITTKKDLAQKIKDEQQVLKMVIEIVTTKEQFMELKSDYEKFIDKIDDFKSLELLPNLRREIHTYKGLFAQKEMLHVVTKLHEFETVIDASLKKNILDDIIKELTTKEMFSWLELDLSIVQNILGKNYFSKSSYISINTQRIDNLYKNISKHLENNRYKTIIMDEIRELKYSNIKIFFKPYEKLVEQLSQQLEKPMNKLVLDIEDIYLSEKYVPFLNTLVHIFRNSMDHGIEDLETRYEKEKDENGTITCDIKKENDILTIKIDDDGAGVDVEKIKSLALEKEIYTQDQLSNMSEHDIVEIIFQDAFSTNESVTTLSGRGVGLASILSELNKINGKMTTKNRFGNGIEFIFSIPIGNNNEQ
ncbi:MAG: ATP-binding protein [Campylobacterota bacterium]|nr:ATP-binding protein [Campylobacterota bacterium]